MTGEAFVSSGVVVPGNVFAFSYKFDFSLICIDQPNFKFLRDETINPPYIYAPHHRTN